MGASDEVFKEPEEMPFSDYEYSESEDFQSMDDYDDPGNYCSECYYLAEYAKLTNAMIEEIKFLRADIVRWRQALIKYLPPRWADGLRQDIFSNIFYSFEDYDAYQDFVKDYCNGEDPLDNEEDSAFLQRLKDGTDETSITYL